MECAGDAFDALTGQQAGKELDHELLYPRRRHFAVDGLRRGASLILVGNRVLCVPAVGRYLDRQPPAPPTGTPVADTREGPRGSLGIGGPEGSKGLS